LRRQARSGLGPTDTDRQWTAHGMPPVNFVLALTRHTGVRVAEVGFLPARAVSWDLAGRGADPTAQAGQRKDNRRGNSPRDRCCAFHPRYTLGPFRLGKLDALTGRRVRTQGLSRKATRPHARLHRRSQRRSTTGTSGTQASREPSPGRRLPFATPRAIRICPQVDLLGAESRAPRARFRPSAGSPCFGRGAPAPDDQQKRHSAGRVAAGA
jgi:hypothetical protein